jgi:hypothetical protein
MTQYSERRAVEALHKVIESANENVISNSLASEIEDLTIVFEEPFFVSINPRVSPGAGNPFASSGRDYNLFHVLGTICNPQNALDS